jgi:hypothetical protein
MNEERVDHFLSEPPSDPSAEDGTGYEEKLSRLERVG